MPVYFAECFAKSYGGGWATADHPDDALRAARRHVAETARTERGSYVLEFPDGADPQGANEWSGGWRANVSPVRVVKRNKLGTTTDDQLLGRDHAPASS
jgi:hypothetical protein